MDFTKLSKWSDRARNFHDFLGDVLEGDRELLAAPEAEHVFHLRDDIENALNALSPGRARVTLETRFASLAPFFEGGFVFEQNEFNEPRLRSMFLLGRVFVPQGKESLVNLKGLPWGHFEGVKRGRIGPLVREYRLEGVHSLDDASVFAYSVRRGVLVLLVCNRPHPWQVGMMEKAYEILMGDPNERRG